MSTRGFWGFKYNNEYKMMYNHSDSYVEWLGIHLVREIKDIGSIKFLKNIYKKIKIVSLDDVEPSDKELKNLKMDAACGNIDLNSDCGRHGTWYNLLRNTQGSLQYSILSDTPYQAGVTSKKYIFNERYTYIIDLTKKTFDIYENSCIPKHKKSLLASIPLIDIFTQEFSLNDDEDVKFLYKKMNLVDKQNNENQ